MLTLAAVLGTRPYPGRGCLAARLPNGELWLAYFLTGRSAPSRARALELGSNGDVRVVDTRSDGEHDALRHYVAAAHRGEWTVIGNGEQVLPLAQTLAATSDAVAAWAAHSYEPDAPIFTPRIWICVDTHERVLVGSARHSDRPDASCDRILWMPERLEPGTAVLMTTYAGTTEHVVTSGLPLSLTGNWDSGDALLADTWEQLNPALRVAAFAARPVNVDGTFRRRTT